MKDVNEIGFFFAIQYVIFCGDFCINLRGFYINLVQFINLFEAIVLTVDGILTRSNSLRKSSDLSSIVSVL